MKSEFEQSLPPDISVSRETWDKLSILFNWHEKCSRYGSFTRYQSELDFWLRHALNSTHLLPHLKSSDHILDIGSGGGFPGLVIAAWGYNVTLSEINPKKRFFLAEAVRLMGLSTQVIKDSRQHTSPFSVVTARAVAPLKKLMQLAPNVSRETRGLFLKGANHQKEIDECKNILSFSHKIHPYSEGVVLEVSWRTS